MIDESALERRGPSILFDSWYVVRDDIDIFNSMGFIRLRRPIPGNWLEFRTSFFQSARPSRNGLHPATRIRWPITWRFAFGNPRCAVPGQPAVRAKVLARATETAPGVWRYNYAVMNTISSRGIDGSRYSFPVLAADTPVRHTPRRLSTACRRQRFLAVWQRETVLRFVRPLPATPLRWGLVQLRASTPTLPPVAAVQVFLGTLAKTAPRRISLDVLAPGMAIRSFADGFEPDS